MNKKADIYKNTDVLVIGNGLAGLSAAYAAAKRELEVTLVFRGEDCHDTGSSHAQGGIIYKSKNDNLDRLMQDFQEAGDHIVYDQAVKQIYKHGAEFVEKILKQEARVPFDTDANGSISNTKEAAHSVARIAHVRDYTGLAIQEHFEDTVKDMENIHIINNATAIDLITLAHHALDFKLAYKPSTCMGAYFYFQNSGAVHPIMAKQTILATGGLGRIYLHTTNPQGIRGDGYAMLYRIGGRIMNMEYVQFHPTTLYTSGEERFLMTEALRGEGAVLRNINGKDFMQDYHKQGSLAPRDIVARSIISEMNRTNSSYVRLDITHKDRGWLKDRFPTVYNKCQKEGIDMATQGIPVVPAAHYECGGIAVNDNADTTIKGLKAVGEVACTGLHGANRLASSSLLECLVYGTLAGHDCYDKIQNNNFINAEIVKWQEETEEVDPDLLREDRMIIRHTMWNYVGIVRTNKKLERAANLLQQLADDIEQFYAHSTLSDKLIGLRNAVTTAKLVLHAAQLNRKSRGCHYRKD
ncbi:MAG: L-aspartate oxidase [Candidatus Marinimicrobia bacterium]|nr:L-aspartate oxidase [Candidatus Neomarinimicrobiota bacterium]